LTAAIIADRLARRLDVTAQRSVGYHPSRPDFLEELIPGHQPVPIGNQVIQQIQYLGFNRDPVPGPRELEAASIELKVTESVYHLSLDSNPV
jgi:hypothetical protein